MKIIFISHEAAMNGGAQACLLELIKGIKEKFPLWEIYVIFPYEGNLIELFLPYISGHTIIKQSGWVYLSTFQKKRSSLTLWKKYLRSAYHITSYINRIKPNHVITNTIVFPSGAIASKILGYKHTWFIHEVPTETEFMSFAFKESFILSLVKKLSSRIVVTSDYALNYYKNAGIDSQKLFKVYQSVEVPKNKAKLERLDNSYTLSLVGTFDPNKGQLELLEAVAILLQRGIKVHCFLVGANDGDYSKQVRTYVKNHKLEDRVTIVPYSSTPLDYFRLADVALVCSKSEAFGRVTIEALKCGIPVIASNVGANKELVKNEYNGYLYHKGNANDLANKIEELSNPAHRDQLRANFYPSILSLFTRKQFTEDFLNVLLEP